MPEQKKLPVQSTPTSREGQVVMSTKEKMVMGGLAQLQRREGSSDEPGCFTVALNPIDAYCR